LSNFIIEKLKYGIRRWAMRDIKKLDKLIEKKRAELIRLFEEKERFDDKIVEKSQELDQLLNYFNFCLKKKAQ